MSKFISPFAPAIEAMLEYRSALGLSTIALKANLLRFDRYCIEAYNNHNVLSKELIFAWIEYRLKKGCATNDAATMRLLAQYLTAIGQEAYHLPPGFYPHKSTFVPYILTDNELSALFSETDSLPHKRTTTEALIAPVLFRLIYTCGLRPNEGRELLRANINFDTGEVFITKTKRKKERLVVMSDEMLNLCRKYDKKIKCASDSVYFFPRKDGKPYTATQIDRLFKRCWEKANPEHATLPNVRTYDLRHRFASARLNMWLDEDRDLNAMMPYLRTYMGHETLNETAYYIHILPENLIKSAGVDWNTLADVMPEVIPWQ